MTEENRIDISEEVNPPVPAHSQPPLTHAPPPPTPAGVPPTYLGPPSIYLPPPTSPGAPLPRVSPTSSTSDDHARIAALEGIVNQLAANMTTNMANCLPYSGDRTVHHRAPHLFLDKGQQSTQHLGFRQPKFQKALMLLPRQQRKRPRSTHLPSPFRRHRPLQPSLFHRRHS
ncbi:hypothetical protein CRG98_003751 [Punica granatum]|uniref:Uncharacterized protein n=1 Tax=Punica granatum TaxID=22663 RepID=A0A2I0L6V5_PUNGR|nr:hypothetical protein CRG98_003751 [Punica granatum]